ncbi:hypothetical protein AX774_g7425, partial [Zancudomyces culisetae]
ISTAPNNTGCFDTQCCNSTEEITTFTNVQLTATGIHINKNNTSAYSSCNISDTSLTNGITLSFAYLKHAKVSAFNSQLLSNVIELVFSSDSDTPSTKISDLYYDSVRLLNPFLSEAFLDPSPNHHYDHYSLKPSQYARYAPLNCFYFYLKLNNHFQTIHWLELLNSLINSKSSPTNEPSLRTLHNAINDPISPPNHHITSVTSASSCNFASNPNKLHPIISHRSPSINHTSRINTLSIISVSSNISDSSINDSRFISIIGVATAAPTSTCSP